MACFITGEASQYPPQASSFTQQGPNGSLEVGWTYGGRCLNDDFAHIDLTLRSLVAWCMCMSSLSTPFRFSVLLQMSTNILGSAQTQPSTKAAILAGRNPAEHTPRLGYGGGRTGYQDTHGSDPESPSVSESYAVSFTYIVASRKDSPPLLGQCGQGIETLTTRCH